MDVSCVSNRHTSWQKAGVPDETSGLEPEFTSLSYATAVPDSPNEPPALLNIEMASIDLVLASTQIVTRSLEAELPFEQYPVPEVTKPKRKSQYSTSHSLSCTSLTINRATYAFWAYIPPFYETPRELRMEIYHYTIVSRLVHYNGFGAYVSKIKLRRQIPVMLSICSESRAEALR